ncbi:MAG: family 43 glycosylhydrolase [Kofleriaceae bacterium]
MRIPILLAAVLTTGCISDEDGESEDTGDVTLSPFHGRFGAPSIVKDGDTLHAYFPIQQHAGDPVHVTHARSTDDGAHWDRVGEALPRLNQLAMQSGSVWAPGAAKIADGQWMLYYSATRTGTQRHMCTYRAHATSPHGPFVDDFAGPMICPDHGLWAIDPYPVKDAHDRWHLLARVDEPNGVNTIAIRALGPAGEQFEPGSEWIRLTKINQGGWEEPVMENAAIVRLKSPNDEWRWYVFYSGGSYRNDTYAIGYADCGPSIDGPCVKQTVTKPWMASRPALKMFGPGTPTFFRDADGDTIMAVNTWKFSGGQDNPKNTGQSMHMFKVRIDQHGKPVATFVRMVD